MKSERRHELQQNDLDAELGKILGWLKRNANRIITVVLVVLVAWLGWTWYQRRQSTQSAQQQANFETFLANAQAVSPGERVEEIADSGMAIANSAGPELAARTLVEVANFRARQAVLATTAEVRTDQAAKAAELYSRVLNSYGSDLPMVALSHVGLAKLAWDAGDLETARAEAAKAVDMPGLEGHPVRNQALRLAEELKQVKAVAVLGIWKPDWTEPLPLRDETLLPGAASMPATPVTPDSAPSTDTVELPAPVETPEPAAMPATLPGDGE